MNASPLDVFRCPLDGTSLIEASAGTGKTWNLCGLYLRLLLERRLEVQQILVVTFTNAATAELRERIRSRLVETLACLQGRGPAAADPFVPTLLATLRAEHGLGDADMALRLEQALQAFDEASIFTIHGFCQRALGDAPFTAGVPMSLELLADDGPMRLQVVQDFWRRRLSGERLSPALASHLLACKDSPLTHADLLKRQLAKPLSRVLWPAALDTAAPVDTGALNAAHAAARTLWLRERASIVEAVREALPRLNGTVYKPGSLAEAATNWDALLASADALAAPPGLGKLHLLTARCLKPKKNQAPAAPHPFFDQAEALLDLRETTGQALALERLRLLRDLLAEGPPALRRAKRERRVIAFDDMLANLHERLTAGDCPQLAGALRARFPAALIDEFQDTDPLQFAIFQRIYGEGDAPLFLVGDPKQAIYSFRNADLHTYLRAKDGATAQYTLTENQRSTEGLLQALNALFARNPRAFMLPGLDYHRVACGSKPRPVLVDLTLERAPLQVWRLPRDAQGEPVPKKAARRAAVAACAGEIARLLGAAQRGKITLEGKPLAGGDIAVLVRSHAQGSEMRRALAALGVGSVELSQASVFASPDAEDLARVLAAVLEPAREPLLRAALATELMGHDAGAIEAVSSDEARLLACMTRFTGYHDTWLQRGVGVMLRRLVLGEGVNERLLARPDGERRLTNLLHLSECLHEAAQQHAAPEALLRWLQAERSEGRSDDAVQLRLESDRNLVQIVTIHRSKGLEYPVVFCPFLWDGHPGGPPGSLEGREYHDDAGRPVIDFRTGAESEAEAEGIKERVKLERAAEGLRLTYVALTRAVHRCYVVVGPYSNQVGRNVLTTECCRGLVHWLVAGHGLSPQEWLGHKLPLADIDAGWFALAEANRPHVGLAPLPHGTPAPVRIERPAPEALAALAPPRRIPAGWWIGSYSSLAHGARHEGAAVDHDLRALPPGAAGETRHEGPAVEHEDLPAPLPPPLRMPPLTSPSPSPSPSRPHPQALPQLPSQPLATASAATVTDDDILRFPRGAAAGECLHALFERVDFTDREDWPSAIEAALRLRPQTGADGAKALLPRMLMHLLEDVLHTPLPGGLRLADVPRDRRLIELEFTLPSQGLSAVRLAAVLRQHGYPVPPLAFGALSGYLRGFIDLVFEHRGRFYILDWKSNHLGDTPAHYGAGPVQRAMDEHGYHLQYLLYTVALHRYLQRRLPGYRHDKHLGGVFYLFVRGVRPHWTDADGAASGVFAHRPSLQAVEQLSALFDVAREPA